MSKSLRYRVVPSQRKGWFNIVDGRNGSVVAEIKGRSDANIRARGMNRAEDAKAKAKPSAPVGYIEVECAMCPAVLSILPGGSRVCPKCRAADFADIEWRATREAQLRAAEEELKENSYRRVLVPTWAI